MGGLPILMHTQMPFSTTFHHASMLLDHRGPFGMDLDLKYALQALGRGQAEPSDLRPRACLKVE